MLVFFKSLYVLINLDYADKNKLIPVIDMENFPTMYNEKTYIILKMFGVVF